MNLPTPEQIASATPEQLKQLIDSLETRKNELSRQAAVYETQLQHYNEERGKGEQKLVEITGSSDPVAVQQFIDQQTQAANAALATLQALMAPPAQTSAATPQPSAVPAAMMAAPMLAPVPSTVTNPFQI